MNPNPDRDTGKICLGGGMHCPSASTLTIKLFQTTAETTSKF